MKIVANIKIDTISEDKFVMTDRFIIFSINGVVIEFEPDEKEGSSVKRMGEAIHYVIKKSTYEIDKMAKLARDFDTLEDWQYQVLDTVTGNKHFDDMEF